MRATLLLRYFCERLVDLVLEDFQLAPRTKSDTLFASLKRLEPHVPRRVLKSFHYLRIVGNVAAHHNEGASPTGNQLRMALEKAEVLSRWYATNRGLSGPSLLYSEWRARIEMVSENLHTRMATWQGRLKLSATILLLFAVLPLHNYYVRAVEYQVSERLISETKADRLPVQPLEQVLQAFDVAFGEEVPALPSPLVYAFMAQSVRTPAIVAIQDYLFPHDTPAAARSPQLVSFAVNKR